MSPEDQALVENIVLKALQSSPMNQQTLETVERVMETSIRHATGETREQLKRIRDEVRKLFAFYDKATPQLADHASRLTAAEEGLRVIGATVGDHREAITTYKAKLDATRFWFGVGGGLITIIITLLSLIIAAKNEPPKNNTTSSAPAPSGLQEHVDRRDSRLKNRSENERLR